MYTADDIYSALKAEFPSINTQYICLGFLVGMPNESVRSSFFKSSLCNLVTEIAKMKIELYFDEQFRLAGCAAWKETYYPNCEKERCGLSESLSGSLEKKTSCELIALESRRDCTFDVLKSLRKNVLTNSIFVSYKKIKNNTESNVRIEPKPGIRTNSCNSPYSIGFNKRVRIRPDYKERIVRKLRYLSTLGEAVVAFSKSDHYKNLHINSIAYNLRAAHETGQLRIYKDSEGVPAGLLMWAWISNWTRARLVIDGESLLHQSEWNEGDELCFREISVSQQSINQIEFDIAGGLFPEETKCMVLLRAKKSKKCELVNIDNNERGKFGVWIRKSMSTAKS